MKNKIISLLLTLCMVLSFVPVTSMAENSVKIYGITDSFKSSGKWLGSSLTGVENYKSLYSAGEGIAVWQPDLAVAGKYKISLYNLTHDTNASEFIATVCDRNGKLTDVKIKHKGVEGGYVELGTFELSKGSDTYVKITSSSKNFTRLNVIKYELIEQNDSFVTTAKIESPLGGTSASTSTAPAPSVELSPGTTIYDIDSIYFKKDGKWFSSGILGFDNRKSNYLSGAGYCIWQPDLLYGGKYRVSIWNVAQDANAPSVTVEVYDKNGMKSTTYKHAGVEAGFVDLGEYEFEPGKSGYVKVLGVEGSKFVRVSSIKYELLDKGKSIGYLVPKEESPSYEGYPSRNIPEREVKLPEIKSDAVKIYVAAGSNGDGSEQNPFGTLTEAQSKVREIIARGYPASGIGVYVKGGTYPVDKTFTFTNEDSGTSDTPVIWQAYNGEDVTITGGKVITSDAIKLLDDEEILNRIPTAGKGKVYVADLSKVGISNIPSMDLINSVPYVFVMNNKAGILSRWPNEGYGRTGNLVDSSSRNDSGPRKKGFTYSISDPRPLRWTKADDIWLNGYWMTPYTINYSSVANLDVDNMIISGKDWNYLGAYGDARYFALNILDEIDSPGEWYVDRKTNKLYFYPYVGYENAQFTFAPENFDIINFDGSSNVIMRDFKLSVAGGSGVKFSNTSSYCGFIGGEIINVSGTGASINGKYNYVRDCDISYTGAQGITITGGNEYLLERAENYAENNEIHDVGTGGGSKQGITINGCGNRVSNNHVYNILTHGINGGGMELTIEYNIVERTNLEMGDTGGIYFLNYGMGYGSEIKYNIVRDNVGLLAIPGFSNEGALGIYLDDMTSGVKVFGNLVINALEPGLMSHGGRNQNYSNNILVNCDPASNIRKSSITNHLTLSGSPALNIKKYDNDVIKAKYPKAIETLTDDFGEPKYNIVKNNVAYSSGKFNVTNVDGVVENNINFDGMPKTNFTDFYDFDYSEIKAQIPDFEELPFNKMGIYKGGARTDSLTVVFDNRAESFGLTYPLNGETNVDPTVTMKWSLGKGGIKGYTVYIGEDKEFDTISGIKNSTSGTYDAQLEYGKTYYWRVSATPMLGYKERWSSNGVFSFTTMTVEDKLAGVISTAKFALNKINDENGGKQALQQAVSGGESASDKNAKIASIKAIEAALKGCYGKVIPNIEDKSTYIYDDYTLDTVDQRPLGLFLRSYYPLNVKAAIDPLNSDNKVVCFKDEHPQYHYGMRYFESQSSYVEFGTSVMAAQSNGSFEVSLMKTGVYPVEAKVYDNCAAKVIFASDGNIYGDKNKKYNLMPYEANKWYDIKALVRLYNQTYDVYVNGEKKAENVPLADGRVTAVNQIVFDTTDGSDTSAVNVGTFYIDNTIVKAPTSYGNNPYLMSLKVNGREINGFDPAKSVYQSDLSADDLKNASIEYVSGKNANVNITDINSSKVISIINADGNDSYYYVIKSK